MTELVESIATARLIHFGPVILLEDAGGAGYLGNDTKGIFLCIVYHFTEAEPILFEVVVKIPEDGAEVTVLIVEEGQIDNVVCGKFGVVHADNPEVAEQIWFKFVKLLSLLDDPVAKAFLSGSMNGAACAIQTLEHTIPDVLLIEVRIPSALPAIELLHI